jgi:hypothetical protein
MKVALFNYYTVLHTKKYGGNKMSRWRAGFTHLLLSLFVVGSVAAYVIYFWYPLALLPMAKADELLMMVGGIDLIVGPLLTLIVYKHGKKTLKFDLTVIALIQSVFLGMGLYTLFQSRPVYLVATDHMFNMVFANEILKDDLNKAQSKYQTLSISKPKLVGAVLPSDLKERNRITLSALGGGADLQHMPQHYVDYAQVSSQVLKNAMPIINPPKVSAQNAATLQQAAIDYGYTPNDVRFMHLGSARGYAVVLIDAKTAQPIGFVNLDL